MALGIVTVPTRFESLRDAVGPDQISQVLLEARPDLAAIKESIVEVEASGQGKLLFLLGASGVGKTSLAASTQVYLPNLVSSVITPPPDYELPIGDLAGWLARNVDAADSKKRVVLINLDGRELPAVDEKANQAAMVNLNAFLRRTKNVLAVWPVVSREFAEEASRLLVQLGGQSALANKRIHEVQGLEKERYVDALQLILNTTGTRLEDAAIDRAEVEELVGDSTSLGEYLSRVRDLVVARYDIGELGVELPKLYVVVSSNGDSTTACRMLRRGNKFLADPERLLQFSRANVADDWKRFAKRDARHSLSFIASLFEVRLVNLTSSAVVNACAFADDPYLREVVRKHYPSPVRANAANTMVRSSLVRSLRDEEDVAPVGTAVSPAITAAYTAIQKLSKDRHRAINEAIVKVLVEQIKIELPKLQFEYQPHEHEELRIDCWFERGVRPETLEFTHRQAEELSPATISSYVLGKVLDYARDYSLI